MSILKINGCEPPSVATMAFHKKTRRLKLTVLWTARFHDKTEEIPFLSQCIVKLTMLIMVGHGYGLSE